MNEVQLVNKNSYNNLMLKELQRLEIDSGKELYKISLSFVLVFSG